jgi:hypothetical protein
MNFIKKLLETFKKGQEYDELLSSYEELEEELEEAAIGIDYFKSELEVYKDLLLDAKQEVLEKDKLIKLLSQETGGEAKWVQTNYYVPTQRDKESNQTSYNIQEATKMLKKFSDAGCKVFRILDTNSMEPLLDDNTVIACEPLNEAVRKIQPLNLGHICLYEADWNNSMVIHMIIGMREVGSKKQYRFRGLNNFRNDPGWVDEEKIKYRLVGVAYAHQDEEND